MAAQPFATVEDLEKFWKTLDAPEEARASDILAKVSNYLRQVGRNNNVDIDAKIGTDPNIDEVYKDAVQTVVLSATVRLMNTPTEAPSAESWSMSATPYSESMRFSNQTNSIYFKASELQLIGLSSVAGRGKFGLLRGVRG